MRTLFYTTIALLLVALSQAFLPPMPASSSSSIMSRQAKPQFPSSSTSLPLVNRPVATPPSTFRGREIAPLYGIFGLGTPELVVIALVAGIVLGPDKIVDLARGIGKAAGELKAVPQEFEKGLKTGEDAAIKAKSSSAPSSALKDAAPKEDA